MSAAGLRHPALACGALLLGAFAAGAGTAAARQAPAEGAPAVRVVRAIDRDDDVRTGLVSRMNRALRGENPSLFDRPYGVAWSGTSLVVSDPNRRQVLRIDLEKNTVRPAELPLVEPIGVAACFGGIAVTDSGAGSVLLLDHDLRLRATLATGLARPTGAACLGDTLAVAETAAHRITFLSLDGVRGSAGSRGVAPGQFNFPTMLAAAAGRLFVCDAMNFRVQVLDRAGLPLGAFGQIGDVSGTMPRLKGIAVDRLGRVWVSDAQLDELSVYGGDGRFLMAVGLPGSAEGAFAFPAGLAFGEDGMLAIADSLNRRVQVLQVIEGGRP